VLVDCLLCSGGLGSIEQLATQIDLIKQRWRNTFNCRVVIFLQRKRKEETLHSGGKKDRWLRQKKETLLLKKQSVV
jgi:hypothetical protein